ncbi:hypothetical protein QE381_001126 [Microbacterium sp. SORGH_AS 888]|nr:hypothetical protein [Microbacterium sp. SORGH_AS_0888]
MNHFFFRMSSTLFAVVFAFVMNSVGSIPLL